MYDLLGASAPDQSQRLNIAPSAVLLRGRAISAEPLLLAAIQVIAAQAPFRRMITPGGFEMSVAMTNCGEVGWITDRKGYRYDQHDPVTGRLWPPMPPIFRTLAGAAASDAGFEDFIPDACLINRYEPGARLSLHQDKNERDFASPIVSISLGLPAVFLFGGSKRNDATVRVALSHGDIVIWGGPSRLAYHGVLTLKDGYHPVMGRQRINLTLRKAL
jgi:DNA oxidative demethylase